MNKISKWLCSVLILCMLGSMMPFALADGAETEPAEEAAATEEAAPAEEAAEAAEEAGCPRVRHFDDKEELARYLLSISGAGDTVLFKGSRGMALEDIIRIFSREEN